MGAGGGDSDQHVAGGDPRITSYNVCYTKLLRSLIRKVLEVSGADLDSPFEGRTLGETLLTPTRIYVKPLLALLEQVDVHSMAHITGGGLPENLPRA